MYFLSWTWSGLGSSPLLSGHSVQLEVGLLCFQLGALQIEEQNLGCNVDCVVSGVWVMFLLNPPVTFLSVPLGHGSSRVPITK